jgi:HSP20 family protein
MQNIDCLLATKSMTNSAFCILHMSAMTNKKTPEGENDPKIDINVNLGGVFKGLGDMMNLIAELAQQGGTIAQSGEFKGKGNEGLRGVYGFNIRTGIGGTPTVERFGTIRKPQSGAEAPEVREPLVDMFDEGTELVIIAEVPGVSDAEIVVRIEGDVLALETSGERRYAKEIVLPQATDLTSLQRNYRNGILELRVRKV